MSANPARHSPGLKKAPMTPTPVRHHQNLINNGGTVSNSPSPSIVSRIRSHLSTSKIKLVNRANTLTSCGRRMRRDISSEEDLRNIGLRYGNDQVGDVDVATFGNLSTPASPAAVQQESFRCNEPTTLLPSLKQADPPSITTEATTTALLAQQGPATLPIGNGNGSVITNGDSADRDLAGQLSAVHQENGVANESLSVTIEPGAFNDQTLVSMKVIDGSTPGSGKSGSVFARVFHPIRHIGRSSTQPKPFLRGASTDSGGDNNGQVPPSPPYEEQISPGIVINSNGSIRLPSTGSRPGSPTSLTNVGSNNSSNNKKPDASSTAAAFYRLTLYLNEAHDLIAMDRCGTSDPYVRVKVDGKTAYKTKTIMRDLDPVWNEVAVVDVDRLQQSVVLSVWDYDRGSADDFIGAVELDLSTLELDKVTNHRMVLKEKVGILAHGDMQRRYLGYILFSAHLKPVTAAEIATELKGKKFSQSASGDWDWKKVRSEFYNMLSFNSQPWRHCLHVVVVGVSGVAVPLSTPGDDQVSVYVRVCYASESERTRPVPLLPGRSRRASFREAFNFYVKDEIMPDLVVELFDGDGNELLGRTPIELSRLAIEQTHRIEKQFVEDTGSVELTVSLTGTRQDVLATSGQAIIPTWKPWGPSVVPANLLFKERDQINDKIIEELFSFRNTLKLPGGYCGFLVLKVLQARNLTAADIIGGKSDPFCVIEIVNVYLRTHTEYKTLEPKWNRVYFIPIDDINSLMTITVFDEDRDKKADFLGKLSIPLLKIQNCRRRWFALKNNRLSPSAKGFIELEAQLFYNQPRAVFRAINPKELPYTGVDNKISIKDLQRDIARLKQFGAQGQIAARLAQDCVNWVSPPKSILALILWCVAVYYFELWMAPLGLGLFFAVTYFMQQSSSPSDELISFNDNSAVDVDLGDDTKLSLKEKFSKVQDVALSAQKSVDEMASTAERIRNIVLWRSPWVSMVVMFALLAASLLLYFVPLRWLLIAFGINKLTKKKLRPKALDNFEPYDLISRALSDIELVNYRDLPIDKRVMHDIQRQQKRDERVKNKPDQFVLQRAPTLPPVDDDDELALTTFKED